MAKIKKTQQLTFPYADLDSDQTRQRVEEFLETVQVFRRFGFVRREATITHNASPQYHQRTNTISRSAEDIALWNVSKEDELQRKSDLLDKAMSKLNRIEREIVNQRYMTPDEVYDYNVAADMCIGEKRYRELRDRALFLLAFALRLEVYNEPEFDRRLTGM
ncbi:ArpU family phage packaging/lysis transcriptional regulator [Paenibacillus sp. RS8]|uniref:ArpU family phage packaging/lysis transcriptional regulator n=1 Tax=Paenibacillus sp. RS8 TaxID=3242681 RepID=UPI0035BFCB83